MPWNWERALRRDSALWDDFATFLDGLETDAMHRLVSVDAADHDRHAGVIEGIRLVRDAASAEHQEEKARASR